MPLLGVVRRCCCVHRAKRSFQLQGRLVSTRQDFKDEYLASLPWPRVLQSLNILEPLLNCRSIIDSRHPSRLQSPWSRSLHPLMSSTSVKVCAAFRSNVQSILKQIASASLVCLVDLKRLETSGRGKRRARTCVMPGCCHSHEEESMRDKKIAPKGVKSIQAALIPAINGMNVVGLVSIPGMMTGQILGGAPPMKAANYQIVITFLISGCSFAALCLICAFTIQAFFDHQGRHDDSEVKPQSRLNIAKLLDLSRLWPSKKTKVPQAPVAATPLLEDSASPLVLQPSWEKKPSEGDVILDLSLEGLVGKLRPLKVQLKVRGGQVLCLMGPSGVGKSTILKWIADLTSSQSSRSLRGQSETIGPQRWRREVLYLHQIKAPLPGTPATFIQAVEKLQANAGRPPLQVSPLLQSIGLEESMLERKWSELSGGENQRMMFAIAMATAPACLVLDEPTSALDEASKLLVEEMLKKRGHDSCIIMATHDAQQAERVGSSLWTFSVTP
eukprot:s489_g5.t1